MLKNNKLKNIWLAGYYGAASLLSFNAHSVQPSPADILVEGSYVVTFNDPVGNEKPVIDLPPKTPHGQVPFGENSTGQSKKNWKMT